MLTASVSPSPPIVNDVPSIVIAPPASTSTVLEGVRLNDVIPVSDTAPAPVSYTHLTLPTLYSV